MSFLPFWITLQFVASTLWSPSPNSWCINCKVWKFLCTMVTTVWRLILKRWNTQHWFIMYHYYFFSFTCIFLFANIYIFYFYFHVCFAAFSGNTEYSEKYYENVWILSRQKEFMVTFMITSSGRYIFICLFGLLHWDLSKKLFYTSGK